MPKRTRVRCRDVAEIVARVRVLEVVVPATELGKRLVVRNKKVGSLGAGYSETYTIRKSGDDYSCTCPDHRFRGRLCKHILKLQAGEYAALEVRDLGYDESLHRLQAGIGHGYRGRRAW